MLKIKDDIDLKELEKFGFKYEDDDYIRKEQYETLYDLIKADLVEKVSDDND